MLARALVALSLALTSVVPVLAQSASGTTTVPQQLFTNPGISGTKAAPAANQIPVFPGSSGAAVPTTIGGTGGLFDAICSSTVGQLWVRLTGGWGCTSLGYANPVWWGADPTGASSSSTAIASAQSAASFVLFPCGTYKVTSGIIPASNQRLIGAAFGCVTINESGLTNTTTGIFDIASGVNNVTIENFLCGAYAGGTCLWQHGGQTMFARWIGNAGSMGYCARVDDVFASTGGIDVQYFIDHLQCNPATGTTQSSYTVTDGILVGAAAGTFPVAGLYISNPNISGATTCGVRIINASGIRIFGAGEIINNSYGICTYPGVGQTVESLDVTDVYVDTNTNTGYQIFACGGTVSNMHVTNLWANSNGQFGVQINPNPSPCSGGSISGVSFFGGHVGGSKYDGFCIQGGGRLNFIGIDVYGNGTATANTYNGYTFAGSGAVYAKIIGGESFGTQQASGVWIGNGGGSQCANAGLGAPDYIAIVGFDGYGNTSAAINLSSTPVHYVADIAAQTISVSGGGGGTITVPAIHLNLDF